MTEDKTGGTVSNGNRKINSCLQVVWFFVLVVLAIALILIMVASGDGGIDEKRNIDLAKINPGIDSNNAVRNKVAEYKMWFSGLYNDKTTATSTAGYLRYTIMDNDDGTDTANFIEERADFIFPEDLTVKPFYVKTVEKEELSDWQKHILHVSPEAFTDHTVEEEKLSKAFNVAYTYNTLDPKPLVKRTVLRKHRSESFPVDSGLVDGTSDIGGKETEFDDIRDNFPSEGYAKETGLLHFKTLLGLDNTTVASKKLETVYFTRAGTKTNATTNATIPITYYHWFTEVDMYEKVVPDPVCATSECALCYRLTNATEQLKDEERKSCQKNFNLLMGMHPSMDKYLKQCNHKHRVPTIVWPMYAWTLNILTLPAKYLTDMNAEEKGDDTKIMVGLKKVEEDDDGIFENFSKDGADKLKFTDSNAKVNIADLSKEDRQNIVFGNAIFKLDETSYRLCLVDEAPQSTLQKQSQCVRYEESFRYAFKNGAVLTLFSFMLVCIVLLIVGVFINLSKLFAGTENDVNGRPFVLQYASDFRRKCELYAYLIRVDQFNDTKDDKKKWKDYTEFDLTMFLGFIVPLFVILVSLLGFVIVLSYTSVWNNGIGPTCSDLDIDMYTAAGLDQQTYVKDVLVLFFLWSGWIFVGVLIVLSFVAVWFTGDVATNAGGAMTAPTYVQISNMHGSRA